MQKLLKYPDSEDTSSYSSAFKPLSPCTKSPQRPCGRRDSGYISDCSPVALKTCTRRFTFDDNSISADNELSHIVGRIDISAREEVGIDNVVDHSETYFRVIKESDEDTDADREVEALFCEKSPRIKRTEYNIQTCRPVAPLPVIKSACKVTDSDISNSVGASVDLSLIVPSYKTVWDKRDNHVCRNLIHTTANRSVGTQTPTPTRQEVEDHPHYQRVTCCAGRKRLQSEGGPVSLPLPDVVPRISDRSLSLPDVPSLQRVEHEQHVGRELRRISDDFHSVYLQRNRSRLRTRSEDPSTPSRFAVDLPRYWDNLRRFVSSSPICKAMIRDDC